MPKRVDSQLVPERAGFPDGWDPKAQRMANIVENMYIQSPHNNDLAFKQPKDMYIFNVQVRELSKLPCEIDQSKPNVSLSLSGDPTYTLDRSRTPLGQADVGRPSWAPARACCGTCAVPTGTRGG